VRFNLRFLSSVFHFAVFMSFSPLLSVSKSPSFTPPRATPKSFASDNNAGAHPAVIAAIARASAGDAPAYGGDFWTAEATRRVESLFAEGSKAFFAFNGTGANVIALQAMTRSHHAILCADVAHVNVDECGAPEKFTGAKLLPIPTPDGKLTPELLQPYLRGFGVEHHSQPKVIVVTQSNEYGLTYAPEEIAALTALARKHGLYVFMDGARFANATARLGVPPREWTSDLGVDAVSFGGTKNGLLFGEAVVFCNPATAPELAQNAPFIRKQSMQLYSKMRFIAAQFLALLEDDLWIANAAHANAMAQRLAKGAAAFPEIRLTQKVEANGVFAVMPPECIKPLQERHLFYVWNERECEVRWMTAFDTTPEDVDAFLESLRTVLANASHKKEGQSA
jgi:threonine aldolase